MNVKLLEVRDRMTFIPVLAVAMLPGLAADDFSEAPTISSIVPPEVREARRYLLRRCGYREDERFPTIMMTRLDGSGTPSWSDPYGWADRTFTVAHNHIEKHWHDLKDGDVIDVQFILGETDKPKVSERVEAPL